MLYLNNTLLTTDGIIHAFEQIVMNSNHEAIERAVYPLYKTKKYKKNSYLWMDSTLRYVNSDGKPEENKLNCPETIKAQLDHESKKELSQTDVARLCQLNPNHHPQAPILPPSELKQFQNKLKTIFFNHTDPVENFNSDRRFQKHFHRLRLSLHTILSLDDTSNLTQALDHLKQSKIEDLDTSSMDTQFETMDAKYGYFCERDDKTQNEILHTVFKKLTIACQTMIILFEKTYDPNHQLAYRYAYSLMALFLDPTTLSDDNKAFNTCAQSAYKLLSSTQSKNNTPFHDILLMNLQLPIAANFSDLRGWQALIKKEGAAVLPFLPFAYKIEEKLKEKSEESTKRAPKNLQEAQDIKKLITYGRSNEDVAFSDLCKINNVSEERFNQSLNYMASGWPKKEKDSLPDLVISGTGAAQNFYWVKLPISDKRALILGDITKCCQSMGGASEACVRDGCSRSDNGFYVLLQQRRTGHHTPLVDGKINDAAFEIVGQSYAWKSKTGNLCLDSIECRSIISHDVIQSILTDFSNTVLKENSDIKFVNLGRGGKTPRGLFNEAPIAEEMNQGTLYGDAKSQYCIAKTLDHPLNEKEIQILCTVYKKYACSQEFQTCIDYLLYYIDTPSELVNQLDHLLEMGLANDLTPSSLQRLLSLKKHPNLTDLHPVDFTALDATKPISLAHLLWRGDLTRAFHYLKEMDYMLAVKALNLYDGSPAPILSLSPIEQRKIFEAIKEEIHYLIASPHELQNLLRNLEPEQVKILCAKFKNYFLSLFIDAHDYVRTFAFLPPEYLDEIFLIFEAELPSLIKSMEDFTQISMTLRDPEWRTIFYKKMKPLLLSMPKTKKGLINMLTCLPKQFQQECCDEWVRELPTYLLRNQDVFNFMIKHLSPEKKGWFMEEHLKELPEVIKLESHATNYFCSFLEKQNLSNIQRKDAYERCKETILVDITIHRNTFQYGTILKVLPPHQRVDFYESIKIQASQSIKDISSFNHIRRYLPEKQGTEFFLLMQNLLWSMNSYHDDLDCFSLEELESIISPNKAECIKILDEHQTSFTELLSTYHRPFQRAAVFRVLKGSITHWIKTPEMYLKTVELLPTKEANVLYDCLKAHISGLLPPGMESIGRIASAQDFYDKTDTGMMRASKDTHQIYTILKSTLIQVTQNNHDLHLILFRLSPEDRIDFCQRIQDKLLQFIQTSNDYDRLCYYPELQPLAWKIFQDTLPSMVITPNDFSILMRKPTRYAPPVPLSDQQKTRLFEKVKHRLPELIQSSHDFTSCMEKLTPEQSEYLYEQVKQRLVGFVNQIDDYFYMTKVLTSVQQLEFYQLVKHKLPALIKAKNDQNNLLYYCPEDYREELYDAILLHNLTEKIKSIASEKYIKRFAIALINEDNESIKTQFDTLIQCITLHRESHISFHQQSVNPLTYCIETLSLLESQWIKKLNIALELGLEEAQISSFKSIKYSLEQYIEKTLDLGADFPRPSA